MCQFQRNKIFFDTSSVRVFVLKTTMSHYRAKLCTIIGMHINLFNIHNKNKMEYNLSASV